MKKYLKLMRVKHYIKNILVFLPFISSAGSCWSRSISSAR